MSKCIIFGAAEFDSLRFPIEEGDLLIAADGGLSHFARLNRNPDVILGDFDSLGYVPEGARVFPVEKDDTDVMLAIRHGLSARFREFHIYGGMEGKRLDHTVANLQALAFLRSQGARGYLLGKNQIATVIEKETLIFDGKEGILSVFCVGVPARGVTIRGMQYEMEKGDLTADFPLGVSNHFIGKKAEISAESGALLLIWDTPNLPEIL